MQLYGSSVASTHAVMYGYGHSVRRARSHHAHPTSAVAGGRGLAARRFGHRCRAYAEQVINKSSRAQVAMCSRP